MWDKWGRKGKKNYRKKSMGIRWRNPANPRTTDFPPIIE
jgi:hypothetical protein